MSKYDCSKCLDYAHEHRRMCDAHAHNCVRCDISKTSTACCMSDTQEKIDIVQKWSDEHPEPHKKTILDDFKDKYPNCYINSHGIPDSCANQLFSQYTKCEYNGRCTECWNKPLSEVQHEQIITKRKNNHKRICQLQYEHCGGSEKATSQ